MDLVGNTQAELERKVLNIGDVRYKGTTGLYELLFKSKPIGVTEKDVQNCHSIINRTYMNHISNELGGSFKGNKSDKYNQT